MDACGRPRGNVCGKGRDERLRMGVGLFAISLIIGVVLIKTEVSPLYRLSLIIPFWFAGQSFFAALQGT